MIVKGGYAGQTRLSALMQDRVGRHISECIYLIQ